MRRVWSRLRLGLLAALLAPACTCGGSTSSSQREFPAFSVSVPKGWTQEVYGPHGEHRNFHGWVGPGVYFAGPDGEYLDVAYDVGTDYFDHDAWWNATVTPEGRIVVTGDERLCPAGPPEPAPEVAPGVFGLPLPSCLAGDGHLDALMEVQAERRFFLITFGNVKRERAEDLRPFKAILATFKAK
jgi:hypothetical protein